MFVQQIEFDHDAKVCLNESGLNDVGNLSVEELQQAAIEQFGPIVGFVDNPNNDSAIGWKFMAKAKYDEVPEGQDPEFTLETWVVLHEKQPEVTYFHANIEITELGNKDDGAQEKAEVPENETK